MKQVFAYTPPGAPPCGQYVQYLQVFIQEDDSVLVVSRSSSGDITQIVLPEDRLQELLAVLQETRQSIDSLA